MFSALLLATLTAAAPPDFDREIAPLLSAHCTDCHAGAKPKGKLDLTRKAAAARVLAGELWQKVAADEMPPKKPLPAAEKAKLKAWLDAGATWGTDPLDPFRFTTATRAGADWWSLQPIRRPPGNIDHFVRAKLAEKGLALSPEADRRTLIRRVTFDLIGLPPTAAEVEVFVKDPLPDAYEKVVDRLLASPHYGERWARHWLDVVRYGETHGFERNDARPNAYHYRDWVIRALNADLPFDEFARMQIAGDVLKPGDPDGVKATGYLVAGVHNTVLPMNDVAMKTARQDELEDLVGNLGQAFLGLSTHCARCHDHKFDPIPQRDFYRLAAAVAGVTHGERTIENPEYRARAWREPEAARLRREWARWRGEGNVKVHTAVPQPPPATRLLVRGQVTDAADVVAPGGVGVLPAAEFALPENASGGERRKKLAEWVTHPANPLFARVIVNRLWHHHFGTGLVETPSDFGFNGGKPSHPELLDWLASELRNPSPGPSPQRGGEKALPPPSLGGKGAGGLGFSLKPLHRLIVTSAAYKQSSTPRADALAVDADSRLLWRKKPSRLEAESIRDTMLAAAGLLNHNVGGPPFSDYHASGNAGTTYYDPIDPAGPAFHRRSIYRFVPRGGNPGLLDAFDCPDAAGPAPRRASTTTPLQALSLWNGPFALRMSEAFAARVAGAGDVGKQVREAYRVAFQREPTADESAAAKALVEKHGLKALTRALLNANEFLTID